MVGYGYPYERPPMVEKSDKSPSTCLQGGRIAPPRCLRLADDVIE